MSKAKRPLSAVSRHLILGTLQRGSGIPNNRQPATPVQPVSAQGQLEAELEQSEVLDQESSVAPRAGRDRAGITPVRELPLPMLDAFSLRLEYDRRRDVTPRVGSPANQQTSHAIARSPR